MFADFHAYCRRHAMFAAPPSVLPTAAAMLRIITLIDFSLHYLLLRHDIFIFIHFRHFQLSYAITDTPLFSLMIFSLIPCYAFMPANILLAAEATAEAITMLVTDAAIAAIFR
jgi:hypothetical protein